MFGILGVARLIKAVHHRRRRSIELLIPNAMDDNDVVATKKGGHIVPLQLGIWGVLHSYMVIAPTLDYSPGLNLAHSLFPYYDL